MADSKVSALTALTGTNVAADDKFLIVDTSATASKRIDVSELVVYLQTKGMPRVKRLGTQHSISSATPSKVTDLDMTLEAGTYAFDYYLLGQSATITVGLQFNFNFSGTATKVKWWFEYADLSSTLLAAIGTAAHDVGNATLGFGMRQAEDDLATTATGNMGPTATTNAVQTINTDILYKITGLIVVSVAGDLQLYHGSETATATSVEVGSSLIVVRTA